MTGKTAGARSAPNVFVIGAGLAGLSAATALAERGATVVLIEAAGQAGGRCRSYFDSAIGGVIDNGNHLVLSGNRAVNDYRKRIGGEGSLVGPPRAEVGRKKTRVRRRGAAGFLWEPDWRLRR